MLLETTDPISAQLWLSRTDIDLLIRALESFKRIPTSPAGSDPAVCDRCNEYQDAYTEAMVAALYLIGDEIKAKATAGAEPVTL